MNELTMSNNQLVNQESQIETAVARASKEVEAEMIIAKKFPRNILNVYKEVIETCKRIKLAESSEYSYPRGGTLVRGPSIRMAETLAQCFGNLNFGVEELSHDSIKGESVIRSYCRDLEKNIIQTKIFTVKHSRSTKQGNKKLTDSRDIYEVTANNASRRLRACILGVLPADLVEAATEQCRATLRGDTSAPLVDRLKGLLSAFDKLGVSKEMIEKRLNHPVEQVDESEIDDLRTIYNSLKDGISKRENWFEFKEKREISNKSKNINDKIKGEKGSESKASEINP